MTGTTKLLYGPCVDFDDVRERNLSGELERGLKRGIHRMTKACPSVVLIMLAAFIGVGRPQANESVISVNLNGTTVTSYAPPDAGVALAPCKLETSGKMSMLFYRVSVTGTEIIYGLHWYVYVIDSKGKVLSKDSWWDRGEWGPNSETQADTVFEYKARLTRDWPLSYRRWLVKMAYEVST